MSSHCGFHSCRSPSLEWFCRCFVRSFIANVFFRVSRGYHRSACSSRLFYRSVAFWWRSGFGSPCRALVVDPCSFYLFSSSVPRIARFFRASCVCALRLTLPASALSGALLPLCAGLPGSVAPTLAWVLYGVLVALWLPQVRVDFSFRSFLPNVLHSLFSVSSASIIFLGSWPGVPVDSLPSPLFLVLWSSFPCLLSFTLAYVVSFFRNRFPREVIVFLFISLFLTSWRFLAELSYAWWWTPPDSALASGALAPLLSFLGPILSPSFVASLSALLLRVGVLPAFVVFAVGFSGLILFSDRSAPWTFSSGAYEVILEFPSDSDPFDRPPASAPYLWLLSENAAVLHDVPFYGSYSSIAHIVAVTSSGDVVQILRGRRLASFPKRHPLPFIERFVPSTSDLPLGLPVYLCSDASFTYAHSSVLAVHTGSLSSTRPGWRRRLMARYDLRHSRARALESGAYVVRAVEEAPSGFVHPDGRFSMVTFPLRGSFRLPSSFSPVRPVTTFYEHWSQHWSQLWSTFRSFSVNVFIAAS